MAKRPRAAKEVEQDLRAILSGGIEDRALLKQLEALAGEPAFPGLTHLFGPELWRRNRVLFRPFIQAHFSSLLRDGLRFRQVEWKGDKAQRLDAWLNEVDEADDVDLFRRLYSWKHGGVPKRWAQDLLERHRAAGTPAARRVVVAKLEQGFGQLDEAGALELYTRDPATKQPILDHVTRFSWFGEKRELWSKLITLADERGDQTFAFGLYRRQVPEKLWSQDVLTFAKTTADPELLVRGLEDRHPEGYGLNRAPTILALLEARGLDVMPYVRRHLHEIWGQRWGERGAFKRLLALATEKGWDDLWAALCRTCATAEEYDRAIRVLLLDRERSDAELARRLTLLAGLSREWSSPGFGLAQVQPLTDETALLFFQRFPQQLRRQFKVHLVANTVLAYPKLVRALVDASDEDLLDYLASRLATRPLGAWTPKEAKETIDELSHYYEGIGRDPAALAARACRVLTQIPAYAIYAYKAVIRENRLGRLLFERSERAYLSDPSGLRDLLEASSIHVQLLGLTALGLDDDRARQLARDNLDLLQATLLTSLHRKSREIAFKALANAATDLPSAKRILERAKEALCLPDRRYPKETLIGLLGQLLSRFPELRSPREEPVVHRTAPKRRFMGAAP